MAPYYFETNEADDVLASLLHLRRCLSETKADRRAWKWVVLSLFSAIQGSIVCHAAGSTQTEVLTNRSAKTTLDWFDRSSESQGDFPDQKLAGPDTLYKRLNGSYIDIPPAGGVIKTDAEQDNSFEFIKSLRDDFNHFTPRGWLININDVKDSIPPLLRLIEAINAEGWGFRHGSPEEITAALDAIRADLMEF
jgi:hypothetical protein